MIYIKQMMHGSEKIVGYVEGDTYYTDRRLNHYFKIYGGFAISKSILLRLKDMGVKYIVINYYGLHHIKHNFTVEDYLANGIEYNYKEEDLQLILPIKKDGKPKKPQQTLF